MSTALETLFTEIADAIRTKTGSTEAIPALSMATAILGIPTGDDTGGSFDPASFRTYNMTRFLAIDGDNVNFLISKNVFPTLPKLMVVPGVQDDTFDVGGSFVMVRDEELGYRLFFNGKELTHGGYSDDSNDDYFSMTIYFTYDNLLYTISMDDLEKVMFWF